MFSHPWVELKDSKRKAPVAPVETHEAEEEPDHGDPQQPSNALIRRIMEHSSSSQLALSNSSNGITLHYSDQQRAVVNHIHTVHHVGHSGPQVIQSTDGSTVEQVVRSPIFFLPMLYTSIFFFYTS